jgi:hypothetical protein
MDGRGPGKERAEGIFEEATTPLREIVPPERLDRARLFGDALPEGLRIRDQ